MIEEQPEQPENAGETARRAVDAVGPAFVASELQLALFRSDILYIPDQVRARIYGFMDELWRSCSAMIDGIVDDGERTVVSKMAARENLPDKDSLIASVFIDPACLVLLFSRACEVNLVQCWADAGQAVAECPPVWRNRETADHQQLINSQSRFLTNAEFMRLDSAEFSALQWRRIVLRFADVISLHCDADATEMRDTIQQLLADHDESQARLTQFAMYVDGKRAETLTHAHWQQSGPTLFMLELAARLNVPYDALLVASAMRDPALFALALRAADVAAQDIVLIMGETPLAAVWFSSVTKAQQHAAMIARHDPAAAHKALSAWSDNDMIAGEAVFDHWPWTMTV
ncbi:hypothetical protein [Alterisphingorhabdus coralli]|uniref:Uncharacterized protein n=1 Tax=Alterisphingorhabdus coralli TaxID=3071408 RepID=A0AA97HYW3_9SPHN|nr:hypothetical protein [Parasphingorhabdus sp. SCSIO 66989]WOE73939.1 hypothetical protein RB602_08685 [Parasphingorhabdus sp. SCSIO 66989]